jgi:hypothetical protein
MHVYDSLPRRAVPRTAIGTPALDAQIGLLRDTVVALVWRDGTDLSTRHRPQQPDGIGQPETAQRSRPGRPRPTQARCAESTLVAATCECFFSLAIVDEPRRATQAKGLEERYLSVGASTNHDANQTAVAEPSAGDVVIVTRDRRARPVQDSQAVCGHVF